MANILIIDDDPDCTEVLLQSLEEQGHSVSTASTALTALSVMLNRRPDLVFCDVVMPEMDGIALFVAMRDHATLNDVPVILMSAHSRSKVAVPCDGYIAFIQKPFQLREVIDLVSRAL